jgi:membrane protein YqaA with SNARE-associated domain
MDGLVDYVSLILEQLYEAALALGGPGLLVIALLDSSFLSLPEGNDLLIVILSTGQSWERMTYLVLMTTAGSVIGCSLLYWAGRRGGAFVNRPPRRERLKQVEDSYKKWGLWAVLVPSILPPPTPFKVFVLSAGVFKVPFVQFLIAVLVGRSIRYFLWGILAVLYGEWAKQVLQGSLHTVGAVLFGAMVLMTAAYFVWKAVKKRSQRGVV